MVQDVWVNNCDTESCFQPLGSEVPVEVTVTVGKYSSRKSSVLQIVG